MKEQVAAVELVSPSLPHTKGDKSFTMEVIGDATRETKQFLREIALEIDYPRFGRPLGLKVQMFEIVRALAMIDEFEGMDDSKGSAFRKWFEDQLEGRTLEHVRAHKTYKMIQREIQKIADQLALPESEEEWIKRIRKRTRRALDFAGRETKDQLTAAKALSEIFERDMPKQTRLMEQKEITVRIDEESANRLARAMGELRDKKASRITADAVLIDVTPEK